MINIEAVLPDIEHDVENRKESPTLASLSTADLRDLVYELVRRKLTSHLDPIEHFEALISLANDRHKNLGSAREHSRQVKAEVLAELLRQVRPALPVLLGPIVVRVDREPNDHEERTQHPLLVGVELLNGRKEGGVSPERSVVSGTSWWIVALADGDGHNFDARFAAARHYGHVHNHSGCEPGCSVGSIWGSEFSLVTPEQAAAEIRDNQFEKLIGEIHSRLVSVCGNKVVKTTDSMWTMTTALAKAVEILKAA